MYGSVDDLQRTAVFVQRPAAAVGAMGEKKGERLPAKIRPVREKGRPIKLQFVNFFLHLAWTTVAGVSVKSSVQPQCRPLPLADLRGTPVKF